MPNQASNSTQAPLFSVVIAVYNDWGSLEQCLRSLETQTGGPELEVIVVDDGSESAAPESIRQYKARYPVTIVQQQHAGIAAARNLGLQNSRGAVVVFTDADCRFQANCLSALGTAIRDFPQYSCFQLHLTGDCSTLVGRAEELRLITLQNRMLQPNGCIRYLNTSGFAMRRARAGTVEELFDPVALRGEDTLLLANLMQAGELPFFVDNAVVEHVISLSLLECFRKDVRSAWLEGRAYEIIAAKGIRMRMGHKDRFNMLLSMWKTARLRSIGRRAWLVVVARQLLVRIVTLGYQCARIGMNTHAPASAS